MFVSEIHEFVDNPRVDGIEVGGRVVQVVERFIGAHEVSTRVLRRTQNPDRVGVDAIERVPRDVLVATRTESDDLDDGTVHGEWRSRQRAVTVPVVGSQRPYSPDTETSARETAAMRASSAVWEPRLSRTSAATSS